MAVYSYADERDHFCFLFIGLRVMFPQLWHVVAMWGSRVCLMRVVELYPGTKGVLHFLQMPWRMCWGILVLVLWAILLRSDT